MSNYIHDRVWDEITCPFYKLQRCNRWTLGRIHNSIPHFIGHVITFPCWWLKFVHPCWQREPKVRDPLTPWRLDLMAAIWQKAFANQFYWMQIMAYRFKFLWSLFLVVHLVISQRWRWIYNKSLYHQRYPRLAMQIRIPLPECATKLNNPVTHGWNTTTCFKM